MTPEQIAGLMSSMGAGAVILTLVTGVFKWLSGASARERERNSSLAVQRLAAVEEAREAESEREAQAKLRFQAEEHVSILKRQLLENGITPRERSNESTSHKTRSGDKNSASK